jgi:hypothetical protein
VAALAAILRLALALDRTHQQHVADVQAIVDDRRVLITVDSQGDTEVDLWAAERKVELFEKVFGREVRFAARSTRGGRRPRSRRSSSNGTPVDDAANGSAPQTVASRIRPK